MREQLSPSFPPPSHSRGFGERSWQWQFFWRVSKAAVRTKPAHFLACFPGTPIIAVNPDGGHATRCRKGNFQRQHARFAGLRRKLQQTRIFEELRSRSGVVNQEVYLVPSARNFAPRTLLSGWPELTILEVVSVPRSSLVPMKLRALLSVFRYRSSCFFYGFRRGPESSPTAADSNAGQAGTPPATGQNSCCQAPAKLRQSTDPLKRPLTDKEKKDQLQGFETGVEQHLQEVAQSGRGVHHHAGREVGLQAALQRRGARPVHRAVLAASRSHAGHAGKRVQGRALPPHRLRQRALRRRHSRAGRPIAAASTSCGARRTRSTSHPTGGTYDRPTGRRRRHHHHLSLRGLALSLSGRRRPGSESGVRRSLHVRRLTIWLRIPTTRTRCCILPAARRSTSRWA